MTTAPLTVGERRVTVRRRAFFNVNCFVDWNSQLRLTGIDYADEPVDAARAAFKQATRRISQCLAGIDSTANFQVILRLYHGWRKGYEATANLRAMRRVIAETDFSAVSEKPSVTYSSNVAFGDCLLSALPKRLHSGHGIHLPNTLRDRGDQRHEEKMVDTALASDLVVSAYRDPDEWVLLVAEDDDLIPPLFAAESIINAQSARALLLSKRRRGNNFLLLDGLDVS